jgi:hypothetical protein
LYKEGDSWLEELGFTVKEYDGAIRLIGKYANKAEDIDELLKSDDVGNILVWYKDRNNVTWFYRNDKALMKALSDMTKLSKAEESRKITEQDDLVDPRTEVLSDKDLSDGVSLNPQRCEPQPNLGSPLHTEITSENNSTREIQKPKICEAKEAKPLTKPRQKKMDSRFRNGKRMQPEFQIAPDVLQTAIEMGYESLDVSEERIKYLSYYKNGDGKTKIHWDWNEKFIYEWLDRGYKKGYLKRNGKFYTVNANQERLDKLTEHSKPLFNDPDGDYSLETAFRRAFGKN